MEHFARINQMKSRCLIQEDRFTEALEALELSARHFESLGSPPAIMATVQLNIAQAHGYMGETELAVEELEKAYQELKLAGASMQWIGAQVMVALSFFYLDSGETEKAAELVEELQNVVPDLAEQYWVSAMVRLMQAEPLSAIKPMQEAVRSLHESRGDLSQHALMARLDLALIYYANGCRALASDELESSMASAEEFFGTSHPRMDLWREVSRAFEANDYQMLEGQYPRLGFRTRIRPVEAQQSCA